MAQIILTSEQRREITTIPYNISDYYPPYRDKKTMKTIRHEYLGIYIYESPKNSHELAFNKTMEEKAEIIRCRRFEEIINERYNLYDKQRLNESFIDYYEKEAKKHNQKWIYVCNPEESSEC